MRIFAPTPILLVCLLLLAPPAARAEDEAPRPPGGRRGGGSMWERLRASDKDGDGQVSRAEFPGPGRFFDRLDTDGDGQVTQAEAEAMRGRREGGPSRKRPAPTRAAPQGVTLELADANRDGRISLAEWTKLFAAADTDGDGTLTAAEWKALLEPTTRPRGEAPAVGSKAPAVRAVPLEGGPAVDLSAPKRVTVLIFGSWT